MQPFLWSSSCPALNHVLPAACTPPLVLSPCSWYDCMPACHLCRVEFLTHDISVHVPHHVSSKIPWYNLRLAHDSLKSNWGQVCASLPCRPLCPSVWWLSIAMFPHDCKALWFAQLSSQICAIVQLPFKPGIVLSLQPAVLLSGMLTFVFKPSLDMHTLDTLPRRTSSKTSVF